MHRFVSCKIYNDKERVQKIEKTDDIEHLLNLLKHDNYYHSITSNNTEDSYILYFDIDGTEGKENKKPRVEVDINDFINKMCDYINKSYSGIITINDFCYTKNDEDKYKFHVTVPSRIATIEDQKELCIDFIKIYPQYKKIYDSTVYAHNKPFRLPNQSKGIVLGENKEISGKHIIQRGNMKDFILDNIGDVYILNNLQKKIEEIAIEEDDNKEEDFDIYDDYEESDNITDLLDKFPYSKFYNGRRSWIYFLCLCKNANLTWEQACYYSKKMDNHDPCTCEKAFKSVKKVIDNPIQKIRNLIAKYSAYEYEKIISFNFKNKYDILDFKEEFNNRKYETFNELKHDITYKLMTVCAYIIELECFIIKSNNNIKTLKTVKNCLPKLLLKGAEGRTIECNLQKFIIENTLFNYNTIDYILNDYKNLRIFNIWKGYDANIITNIDQEVIDVVIDLLLNVFCNGDKELLRYVLTWFSNLVSTDDINKVALVIVSEKQGTGKGTLLEFIAKILGSHCFKTVTGVGPLTQKHNTVIKGVRLLVMNEAASTREDFRNNFDKLKTIITDPVIDIEPKGLDHYDVKNLGNYIIVSNHRDSVVIENDDRRYQVLECSSIYANNTEYFTKVRKILQLRIGDEQKMEAANSFYTYLMNYNDKVDLFKIINTPLREEMKERSLPNTVKFILEHKKKLDNLKYDIGMEHLYNIRASDLYEQYKTWATNNTEKIATNTKFGMDIKNYVNKKCNKDANYYVFEKNTN